MAKKKILFGKNGKPVKDSHGEIVYEGQAFVDMFHVFHAGTDDYNPPNYSEWYIDKTPKEIGNPYAPPEDTNYNLEYPPHELVGAYDQIWTEDIPTIQDQTRAMTATEKAVALGLLTLITMGGVGVLEGSGVVISEMAMGMGAPPAGAFAEALVTEGMIAGTGTLTGLSPMEWTIHDAPKRKRNRDLSITEEYPDLTGWLKSRFKKKKTSWNDPSNWQGPSQ